MTFFKEIEKHKRLEQPKEFSVRRAKFKISLLYFKILYKTIVTEAV